MPKTVKRLLTTVETEIFKNWNDVIGSQVKAVSIWLTNASGGAVDVWLSFCVLGGVFSAGMILSKKSIAANDVVQIPIDPRILAMDESVRAFASANNVITLSIDILGIEQDLPTFSPPS